MAGADRLAILNKTKLALEEAQEQFRATKFCTKESLADFSNLFSSIDDHFEGLKVVVLKKSLGVEQVKQKLNAAAAVVKEAQDLLKKVKSLTG